MVSLFGLSCVIATCTNLPPSFCWYNIFTFATLADRNCRDDCWDPVAASGSADEGPVLRTVAEVDLVVHTAVDTGLLHTAAEQNVVLHTVAEAERLAEAEHILQRLLAETECHILPSEFAVAVGSEEAADSEALAPRTDDTGVAELVAELSAEVRLWASESAPAEPVPDFLQLDRRMQVLCSEAIHESDLPLGRG